MEVLSAKSDLFFGDDLNTDLALHQENLTDSEVIERLDSVDWSFASRRRHSPIEALHPYPAKFISDIPAALLRCLPIQAGSAVFDPFCGSGTTLAECQRVGLNSLGVDLNPIACLISRVRTSPIPSGAEAAVREVLKRARECNSDDIPNIPNIDHWFTPEVQLALTRIKGAIDEQADHAAADMLRLCLSSIIVRVSNQDSDTRYAAVKKSVTYDTVFAAFEKAATKIILALTSRTPLKAEAEVVECDTLKFSPERIGRNVGMMITSPPYPNAYEYWLYHKYRMWWLEEDPIAVKEAEIGARAHFFKKNHHTADDFARQMGGLMGLLNEIMLPRAFACFVVGRSKIHGVEVDNARIIEEAGEQWGFRRVHRIEREIARTKKSFNLSHANIKTESLVVLNYNG